MAGLGGKKRKKKKTFKPFKWYGHGGKIEYKAWKKSMRTCRELDKHSHKKKRSRSKGRS